MESYNRKEFVLFPADLRKANFVLFYKKELIIQDQISKIMEAFAYLICYGYITMGVVTVRVLVE